MVNLASTEAGHDAPKEYGSLKDFARLIVEDRRKLLCASVLYAYAAPEPAGFREVRVPPPAGYDARLGEFILPYAAVRAADDPAGAVRAFCESVYDAGARLGNWDRATLERESPRAG